MILFVISRCTLGTAKAPACLFGAAQATSGVTKVAKMIDRTEATDVLGMVQMVAYGQGWDFEINPHQDVTVQVARHGAEHRTVLSWLEDSQALRAIALLDLEVLPHRLDEVLELMVDINNRVRMGAFYCDRECGRLFYRHAVQFPQLGEVSIAQIEVMMTTAVDNIQQYYQAFEFVVNGGVCGAEFLDDHVFETYGTA